MTDHTPLPKGLAANMSDISCQCQNAEILILKHMENTISKKEAECLHSHILSCNTCREYYLSFDEIMEYAATPSAIWEDAPQNFSASVMAGVAAISKEQHLLANAQESALASKEAALYNKGEMLLHILWCATAVVMWIVLFFAYNPEHLTAAMDAFPIISIITSFFSTAGYTLAGILDNLAQSQFTTETNLGLTALAFALALGIMLAILHRDDEKIKVTTD